MAEFGFRFLLSDQGQPYHPSRCYVVADPAIDDSKQWSLQLTPQAGAAWVYEIDDMKDWMLHGKPVRQIIYDRSNPRTPFRNLEREEIFREYLRQILEKIPSEYRARRKFALMPSIADDESRTRYKDAIEAAIPGVTVVPEPEMVAEYFRLLKRTLELEPGRNNVILVVDVGASTANMTVILSRRDSTIVGVDASGAQRDLRLRALRGDSVESAGRWVDRRLAELLHVEKSDEHLREIERAKVLASIKTAEVSFEVGPGQAKAISPAVLTTVSHELWGELRPLFARLCERLYENQTSSKDAKRKSDDRLRELGVANPKLAYRLIDTILLAGGTSLLPGFEKAMLDTLFPDGHAPRVLRVGSSFAIAAAAGGLSHILHNYSPSRLRVPNEAGAEVFEAKLQATLAYPLLLGLKYGAERESHVMLLDPNDPFADDGGKRIIEGLPSFTKGAHPKSRLVPGLAAGVQARQGRQFREMTVLRSPGRMFLNWDPTRQRATVTSDQVEGTGHLWIDAASLRERKETALNPYDEPLEADTLAVDAADDVILDVGMSKIVALTADRGWVSTQELERIIDEGYSSEARSRVALESYDDTEIEIPIGQGDGSIRRAEGDPLQTAAAPFQIERQEDAKPEQNGLPGRDNGTAVKASAAAGRMDQPAMPATMARGDWSAHVADAEFSKELTELRDAVATEAPHLRFDDVVVALLALTVRPVVLLAGPPGCGKSTLVRFIAHVLGKKPRTSFHEIAVQAHWESDDALFGDGGILKILLEKSDTAHLVLFDEFNLTRPEYYLSRLFHALDSGSGTISEGRDLASCRVFGTLNIDESSRPPSPKVVDRCFLLELSQVNWDAADPPELSNFEGLPVLTGLPEVSISSASSDEQVRNVLEALHKAVQVHELRPDLLPSRRVLTDIKATLSLHHRLDLQGKRLLDRIDLIDRLIASRILVKLSGAFDQISPALEALEAAVEGIDELPRTRRRLKLARQQSRLGFVSPWQ